MRSLRLFLATVLAAGLAMASSARAQDQCELAGTVLGKDGAPAANVSVDVLGPSPVYTETDDAGRFTARIRAGTYVIRLRDGARREELGQRVGPCASQQTTRVNVTVHLRW